jgi:hypothetical protein
MGTSRSSTEERVSKRRRMVATAVGLGFLLCVGAALATPGLNVLSAPVHARGTTDGKIDVSTKAVKLKTKKAIDFATQQIVIGGNGHTGWHSHPGPVLVTVKSGGLRVIYANDCTGVGTLYEAGDSFVDRGSETVHIARNESATANVELWATYLVPGAPGTAFRIDAPEPTVPTCNDDDDDDDDDEDDDDD